LKVKNIKKLENPRKSNKNKAKILRKNKKLKIDTQNNELYDDSYSKVQTT